MVKKFIALSISILFIFSMCSCKIKTEGNTLFAFNERLKDLSGYELTTDGYIQDEENKTLTKFFQFTHKKIMLQFEYTNENKLSSLHIVFDNLKKKDTEELMFIENSICAFIENEETANEIMKKLDLGNAIYTSDINTRKETVGNIDILIDITDNKSVISVVKNNL